MSVFSGSVRFNVYIPDVETFEEANEAMNDLIDKLGAVETGEIYWDDVDWILEEE